MIQDHPKEKTLIFCNYMDEMDLIQEHLERLGHLVFRIDGSVDQALRVEMIDTFKRAPYGVFVIQVKSGGQGLNLQEATRVYITSPSWNPATELQAIARAHRTGQTKKVTVRKLVYRGYPDLPSIEESIMALQSHKSVITARVLNDPRLEKQLPEASNAMTARDLKKLFEVQPHGIKRSREDV
jgi:SNF2 family DNA or RNA helicase